MNKAAKEYVSSAVYPETVEDPGEIVNRCPYPRCNNILFKGILAPGSNIELMCRHCKSKLRIKT